MVEQDIQEHEHNGVDSKKVKGENLLNSPQTTLTTAVTTAFSTAGATKLDDSNIAILNNMRTRIAELETKLTNLGLIR